MVEMKTDVVLPCPGLKCENRAKRSEMVAVALAGQRGEFCSECYENGNAAETLTEWANAKWENRDRLLAND